MEIWHATFFVLYNRPAFGFVDHDMTKDCPSIAANKANKVANKNLAGFSFKFELDVFIGQLVSKRLTKDKNAGKMILFSLCHGF